MRARSEGWWTAGDIPGICLTASHTLRPGPLTFILCSPTVNCSVQLSVCLSRGYSILSPSNSFPFLPRVI